jgi:hypothetical protein
LKLKCDEALSNAAFNFNVRRYTKERKNHFNNTVEGWRTWANTRPFEPAHDNQHRAMVLAHDIRGGSKPFRIVMTTPALLRKQLDQRKHHVPYKQADATWWGGAGCQYQNPS